MIKRLFIFFAGIWIVIFGNVGHAYAYFSISGAVISENDEKPLSNITIRACPTTNGSCPSTYTDVNGNYTLNFLNDELSYRVEAILPDDSPYVKEYYDDTIVLSNSTIIDKKSISSIDFRLALGGTITGIVTAEDSGLPIEGISVDVHILIKNCGWDITATTGSDGKYKITGIPPGYHTLEARDSNEGIYINEYFDNVYYYDDVSYIIVFSGSETEIDFQLVTGSTISGTVTAEDTGFPLANISVNANHIHGGNYGYASTDENGDYLITGLAPGEFTIKAEENDIYAGEYYQDSQSSSEACLVSVGSEAAVSQIDFSLTLGGYISGTVIAEDTGFPITDTWVYANSILGHSHKSGKTDDNGRFILGGLFPGEYRAYVQSKEPYSGEYFNNTYIYDDAETITVESGQVSGFVDFALFRSGTITGSIYNKNTGLPVQGVSVFASPYNDGIYYYSLSSSAVSDSDGRYSMTNISPGDYRVSASGGGMLRDCYGSDNSCDTITVESGLNTGFVDFYMVQGATISGVITASDTGLPLSNIGVSARDDDIGTSGRAKTDSNGFYSISGLPAGNYQLGVNSRIYYNNSSNSINYGFILLTGNTVAPPESLDLNIVLNLKADSDNDGMLDQWEEIFGLNTNFNDALFDKDGDGFCNLREYVHMSDPTNKNSVPIPFYDLDVDHDRDVDGLEVIAIINELGRSDCSNNYGNYCLFDIDLDGDVDKIDIALFVEDFGDIYANIAD